MEPLVVQSLWPDRKRGPFLLALYFATIEGANELVGLEIRSVPRPASWGDEPPGSLMQATADHRGRPGRKLPPPTRLSQAKHLRRLKLQTLAKDNREAQAAFARWWASWEPTRRAELEARAQQWQRARSIRTGRPPSRSDGTYIEAALIYEMHPGRGAAAIAEWLDARAGVERGTRHAESSPNYRVAQGIVRECRRRDLIPPAKKEGEP